ncbi:Uncharacterised protein [Mycobacteroides abscessus subsp. bolletii]|nr:Uncharacterised protein [Mycobacteroides abscessus subsp. bolletii]SKG50100.1 Uncharacterised protein [Mycobacteroides abscessus subsp. bolletii]SKH54914.1 Uncharacterised protein [Mycobacteroides abscessus subsp. bolletii]SKH70636.1 Uncharacterised protein [Mycobacteroides abscessus subsp. bolletii]SKH70650.1 Uncharacterised protein [Mycobacteroides abscessus subsp. bolletii]
MVFWQIEWPTGSAGNRVARMNAGQHPGELAPTGNDAIAGHIGRVAERRALSGCPLGHRGAED